MLVPSRCRARSVPKLTSHQRRAQCQESGEERHGAGVSRGGAVAGCDLGKDHELLREGQTLVRLHAAPENNVTGASRSNERRRCLERRRCIHLRRIPQANGVGSWIHGHDTAVPEHLTDVAVQGLHADVRLRLTPVGIDDSNLGVVLRREDVGCEGNGGAVGIVAMNHQDHRGVADWQFRNRKRTNGRHVHLEIDLRADKQLRSEIVTGLVLQRCR
mmetsp:Transcript_65232/g.172894  ORF Transcript_65232/g.172894 Transcript_65232/m.172894 type:complete len:216 (+) Transcript_65232:117-764(+)